MINKEGLEALLNQGRASDSLSDISRIQITGDTPAERLESYLTQIGNPYHFLVGKTPVRIRYQEDGKTIDQKLKSYFLSLKNC